MVQYAHDKMFINDAGCTVPVVVRKLLPFLRYCAARDMDVMIIEVPEPTGFSAGLVYLVLSPLVLSFLWWLARRATAHLH